MKLSTDSLFLCSHKIKLKELLIHRDLQRLPEFKHAILTIGSFDGVHLGHQEIIRKMKNIAHAHGGETVIITFDPHPRITLNKDPDRLRLLTSLEEKSSLLNDYGVDHLVVIPFNKAFSVQSPETYIKDFLIKFIQPKVIVIGYDHRFGHNRAGNIATLYNYSDQYNYQVVEISKQSIDNITISSTKVREAILSGQVEQACEWLGHPYPLSGFVIHGQKLGTGIGFPTANIQVLARGKLIPSDGIYAVTGIIDGAERQGMLYIGTRPTLGSNQSRSIEVNFFNLNQNLYGKYIRLNIHAFIRSDKTFESIDALALQLTIDKKQTSAFFKQKIEKE